MTVAAGAEIIAGDNALALDLKHIASWRARHRGRGDMAYLLTRVRRELESRWAVAVGGDRDIDGGRGDIGGTGDNRGKNTGGKNDDNRDSARQLLLLDAAGGDWRLDAGRANIRRVCALESPAAAQAQFEAAAHTGIGHANQLDGVILCLQAAWLAWPAWPGQVLRALRPGGRLLFCTFGPDTLREARAAWSAADDAPHAHPFLDMHHIGDELLRCGFEKPIVDADWVTVTYPDAASLHADLRAEGFANALNARRKTLTGKARMAAYQTALEARAPGEPLAVTFELIYGAAAAPSGRSRIAVAPPR